MMCLRFIVTGRLLDDLEQGVDRADSKLGAATQRIRKFLHDIEDTKSGWLIGILIAVLLALLLAVILI